MVEGTLGSSTVLQANLLLLDPPPSPLSLRPPAFTFLPSFSINSEFYLVHTVAPSPLCVFIPTRGPVRPSVQSDPRTTRSSSPGPWVQEHPWYRLLPRMRFERSFAASEESSRGNESSISTKFLENIVAIFFHGSLYSPDKNSHVELDNDQRSIRAWKRTKWCWTCGRRWTIVKRRKTKRTLYTVW